MPVLKKIIDLNCDMGEGIGNDEAIMPFISSSNIACGYHAGNAKTITNTILLAKKFNVAVGAHPSFPDKKNFGRTEMQLTKNELYKIVTLQIDFILKITRLSEVKLHHVKPHGALYNMAAKDAAMAAVIAKAVQDTDPSLILYGLSGSYLVSEAKAIGLHTANEVFADRTYQADGFLTPRAKPDALITTRRQAVLQALQMVQTATVNDIHGSKLDIVADTICLHGDGEHAIEFARDIHLAFQKEKIELKSL